MSDFRITWEAPLDTSVVDNIAIFRYNGITQDCSVVLNDGDLVSDTIPVSQTSYDDLGAPELSQVTYAVFSKNAVGYSECALSSESVAPVSVDAPIGLQTTVLTSIYAPTGLQTQDADITVGPEGITAVWQTSPLYAVDGGHYVYPLFLSEAESNYTDSLNGGSGASHTMVYNGVTYYMPNTGGTHAGTQAPSVGTYFDSGVEVERLDETDEAPRDIVAQLQGAIVAPDTSQSPTSIDTDYPFGDVPPSSAESPDNIQTEISQSTVDGQGHHVYSFRVSNTDPVLNLDSGSINVYKEYEGVNPTTGTLSKLTIGSSAILLFDASDAGNYAEPFSPATEGVLNASFVPTASTAFGGWELVEFSDINSNGFYEKVTLTFNPFWMGILQSPDNIQAQEQTTPLTAPSGGPTSISTITSPGEAPSNLSTIASPVAPTSLSTITNPVESARAPSGLTSAVQQQGIAPFTVKEINATGAGTVGDDYIRYYDSYSDGDISVDLTWDSASSTLEITATDANGVTETIHTHTGIFDYSALGAMGGGKVDNENWYLAGYNSTISGDTSYYPDIRIIKRDGSALATNLPDGSSFDVRWSISGQNTFMAGNGKNYYYTYNITDYLSGFSFISLSANENGNTYRKYFLIDSDSSQYIPVYKVDEYYNDTGAYAGWDVTEIIENNYVVGLTITNNTGSTVGPPSTPPSVGPSNLNAIEDPSFTDRVYTANTAQVNGQDSWVDVDITTNNTTVRVYNSYTGPDGYILTVTNNGYKISRQPVMGSGSVTVWQSSDNYYDNISYPTNFYNDMSFTPIISVAGSNEIDKISLTYTYPT